MNNPVSIDLTIQIGAQVDEKRNHCLQARCASIVYLDLRHAIRTIKRE